MGIEKIKTREELISILKKLEEKVVVTTNGVFDILHRGHVETFFYAKNLGDVLIACVNSDSSTRSYKPNRPINNQNDRAFVLSSLECIDYVTIFNEPDPRKILNAIKPYFHVKSKSGYRGLEKDTVERHGGKIILIDDLEGYSTTEILRKGNI